ncbi:hypothetical protein QJQ45_028354, partial [Haematococcus lacustris]
LARMPLLLMHCVANQRIAAGPGSPSGGLARMSGAGVSRRCLMSRTSAQTPAAAQVLALPRPAAPAAIDFTQLQGLLFDIDGTLCNSDPLHFQAFQELLVAQGFNAGAPISEEFFRLHISGRHNPEIALDLV